MTQYPQKLGIERFQALLATLQRDVAKLKTRTTQEWEPIVRFEEALPDCAKKFNIASTGAK